jgi:hypothetical protein
MHAPAKQQAPVERPKQKEASKGGSSRIFINDSFAASIDISTTLLKRSSIGLGQQQQHPQQQLQTAEVKIAALTKRFPDSRTLHQFLMELSTDPTIKNELKPYKM